MQSSSTWMPMERNDLATIVGHHLVLIIGDSETISINPVSTLFSNNVVSLPEPETQS